MRTVVMGGPEHPYLLGTRFTVADAYLFVMLRWARQFSVSHSPRIESGSRKGSMCEQRSTKKVCSSALKCLHIVASVESCATNTS
jgi:hypothetical protein